MIAIIDLLANKYFLWTAFNLLVLVMLALDLGIFHRKDHRISIKEGIIWSVIWIIVALIFNVWIYFWKGSEVAVQFLTGYIIERSLSIDNIFVFIVIFAYFKVPEKYQYKVLFWGILGALILRGLFIAVGTLLIAKFHWIIYIFGAFLVITGIMTNMCCESTTRDAYFRDYRVFFTADGTGSVTEEMHLASLLNLAFGFAWVTDIDTVLAQLDE